MIAAEPRDVGGIIDHRDRDRAVCTNCYATVAREGWSHHRCWLPRAKCPVCGLSFLPDSYARHRRIHDVDSVPE